MSWLIVALALAVGPDAWVLPGLHVQIIASEDLDPDRLRSLARPDTALWVRTQTNGLRRSTAETLRLAGSAFVQVRPPLGAPALGPFAGRVGPWVEERGLDVGRAHRWSPGRLAVDVEGPFTEALAARLRVLRPVTVRWNRGGWPSREEWAQARAFPGVELSGTSGAQADCGVVPARVRVRLRVPLESLAADGACGLAVRIEVAPEADPTAVHAALLAHPDADLLIDVGNDAGRASAARQLIERLAAATPDARAEAPGEVSRSDGGPR
jgi:hypothetical protein